MPYQLNHRASTHYLTPEEDIVRRAMDHYDFNPDRGSATDFVPIAQMYREYRVYMTANGCPPDLLLGVRAFGVALRRVFDISVSRKKQRWIEGKLMWGYTFIQGPGVITTRQGVGRPRLTKGNISCASSRVLS